MVKFLRYSDSWQSAWSFVTAVTTYAMHTTVYTSIVVYTDKSPSRKRNKGFVTIPAYHLQFVRMMQILQFVCLANGGRSTWTQVGRGIWQTFRSQVAFVGDYK